MYGEKEMEERMKLKKNWKKAGFLFLLILVLSMGFGLTSSAAVSIRDMQKVSGGKLYKTRAGKWMYLYEEGGYAKDCLIWLNGKIYYFSSKGFRLSGWQTIDGNKYYFGTASQGYMYRNRWVKTKNGNYYLMQANGKCAAGWIKKNGKLYYFDKKTGVRKYGWQTINGKKYYLGTKSEGWMYRTTWITYKNKRYYIQKNGAAATGWKTISGCRYYFNVKGQAITERKKISGTYYTFDSDGKLLYSGAKLQISSDCAILINAKTGKVLYAKNADTKHANASTTKIMTCILALQNSKLSDKVTVSANAAAQEPSKLYMQAGDSFRMRDLLYSLMLPSHNDTAVAIAEHISGDTESFVQLMNEKAKAIGCTNTHFATPNGLDQNLNHYSTARDVATMARYAMLSTTFQKIVKTSFYTFTSTQGRTYSISTTNALLNTLDGVIGMKTGYTNKAGHCFVGAIKAKKGTMYISVVLGGDTSTERWEDSRKLLQYAYERG